LYQPNDFFYWPKNYLKDKKLSMQAVKDSSKILFWLFAGTKFTSLSKKNTVIMIVTILVMMMPNSHYRIMVMKGKILHNMPQYQRPGKGN
jgi:hypothetical protein